MKNGATVSKEAAFSYSEEGSIVAISPTQGQRGTRVIIKGIRLHGGGNATFSVTLAGVEADVLFDSDEQIIVSAGERVAGTGHVVVTSVTGAVVTSGGENQWTYAELGT